MLRQAVFCAAGRHGWPAIIDELLQQGAPLYCFNFEGETVLHEAVNHGQWATAGWRKLAGSNAQELAAHNTQFQQQ